MALLVLACCAGLLAVRSGRRTRLWLLSVSAAGALLFQVLHLAEHGAQLAAWTANPRSAAWMSPWAQALAAGFARLPGATPALGMELLHLAGNAVLLAGVVSAAKASALAGRPPGAWARRALLLQALHVAEHVALSASVAVQARAVGLSTLGGTLSGTSGVAVRVWWHFAVNLAVTLCCLLAVREVRPALGRLRPAHARTAPRRRPPFGQPSRTRFATPAQRSIAPGSWRSDSSTQ